MKAFFVTACGCSQMVDVTEGQPMVQLPLRLSLTAEPASHPVSFHIRSVRTFKLREYTELYNEPKIGVYYEVLDI